MKVPAADSSTSSNLLLTPQQDFPFPLIKTERLRENGKDLVVNTLYDKEGHALFRSRLNANTGRLTVINVSKVGKLSDEEDYDKNAQPVVSFNAKGLPQGGVQRPGQDQIQHISLEPAQDRSPRALKILIDGNPRKDEVLYSGIEYIEGPVPSSGGLQDDQRLFIKMRKLQPTLQGAQAEPLKENNMLMIENCIRAESLQNTSSQYLSTWQSQAMMAVATDSDTARKAEGTQGQLADWRPEIDIATSGDGSKLFSPSPSFFESGRFLWQSASGLFSSERDKNRPLEQLYNSLLRHSSNFVKAA